MMHAGSWKMMARLAAAALWVGPVLAAQDVPPGDEAAAAPPAGIDPSRARLSLEQIGPAPQLSQHPPQPDQTSEQAERQIAEALELFEQQRYTESIQRLERALRYSPGSLAAHRLMALMSLEAGNPARARQHLDKALEIEPQSAELHYLAGRAADGDTALDFFRRALVCPGFHERPALAALTHYHLARTLEELGYLQAAIAQYKLFLEAADKPVPGGDGINAHYRRETENLRLSAHLQQASLFEKLGEVREAAQCLQAAVAHDPDNTRLLQRTVELLREAGDLTAAADIAVRLAGDSADGLDLLIEIHRGAASREPLLKDLERLHAAQPQRYEVIEVLAGEYQAAGRSEAAVAMLGGFLKQNPEHVQAAAELSDLHAALGQWDDALNVLGHALADSASAPTLADAWLKRLQAGGRARACLDHCAARLEQGDLSAGQCYLVGRLAMELEERDLAGTALQKALAQAPEYVPALLASAELALQQYQWDEARRAAEQAAALDARSARAQYLLGRVHLGLDEHDRAAEALALATSLDRRDLDAMLALADVYEASGKPLQARRQYQIILEIDPHHGQALERLFQQALQSGAADQARRHLEALEAAGEPARYRRCRAQQDLLEHRTAERYAADLRAILKDFPGDIPTRLQLVQQQAGERDFKAMAAELDEILKLQPDHTDALYLRSWLHLRNLEFAPGIDILQDLLHRHPNRTPWKNALAGAMISDQRFAAAAELLQGYLAADHLDERVRERFEYDLLMCLLLSDQASRAEAVLEGWLASAPQRHHLRLRLLDIYRFEGQTQRGVERAERWFAEADPAERKALRQILVESYLQAGRSDDAAVLVLDALELDPEAPESIGELLEVLRRAKRYAEAVELTRSSAVDPQLRDDYDDVLVSLYREMKAHDEAIRLLRDRLSAFDRRRNAQRGMPEPRETRLRTTLCLVFIEAGRYDQALRELTEWQESVTDAGLRTDLLRLLAYCHQASGREGLARQEQEKLYELDPDDPGVNNDLGYTWANEGVRIDQAVEMIRLALGAEPRRAAYLDSMGWALYKKGDFGAAREWLERAARAPSGEWYAWLGDAAHERGADDPVICDHLGDAAWRMGASDEAVRLWQRAGDLARKQIEHPDDGTPPGPEVQAVARHAAEKTAAAGQGESPQVAASTVD